MLKDAPTSKFRKDLKLMYKQGKDTEKLQTVIDKLRNGEELEAKYQNHFLTNNWKGSQECHIEPDWLLIYKIDTKKIFYIY